MQRRTIRRALGLATAAAVAGAGALIGVAPAGAAPTTVNAVDFEDGTTGGWTQSGGGAGLLEVVDGPDGGKVLRVNDRAADYEGIQSPLGLFEPGKTYDFSMRVRLADGVAGSPGVRFVLKPAYTWIGNTTVSADAWTTVHDTLTIPAGADPEALQLYIGTGDLSPVAPYSYLVDDIAITTEAAPEGPGTDVLATDFESGLDGWGLRGGSGSTPAVVQLTGPGHESDQAALVTGRASQGDGLGHDVTGLLDPSTTYELSAWVRFADGQPVDDVWLSRANTVEGATTFSTLAQFDGVTNSGWTQVTARFQGSAAEASQIYFETRWSSADPVGNTSDLLVDDISLVAPGAPTIEDLTPIKDTVDFPVGVAIDSRETAGAASELLLKHFDRVTPENFMKPEAWYDAEGNFRTVNAESDALMDFAQANDLKVYGHVLVWHSQTPAWFFQDGSGQPLAADDAGKAVLRERLRTHIFDVAGYLAGKYGEFGSDTNPLAAIDVVNEVVSDGGEYADGLRRSEWFRILGEDFIDLAFEYADEAFNGEFAAEGADRPVTLFINDYNTEQGGKQVRYHALVERLLARGVPVDGVGHQFHVSLAMPVSALEQAIVAFEDLPVTQAVTEFDVTTGTPVTTAKLIDQGYYYRDAFRVFRAHTDDLFSVTMWGLTDGRSWRNSSGAPLVFDDSLKAKPAYYGIVDGELAPRARTANVFQGDVALDGQATASPEWAHLPLIDVEGDARFQLRWEADHLTVFASVDDASSEASDAVAFTIGDRTWSVDRTGAGDVPAVAVERTGGYDLVAHLPLDAAALGDTLGFDLGVTDGAGDGFGTIAWNSPGELGTLTLVEPVSYVDVVRTADAPVVDGAVDEAWADADPVTTEKQVQGTDGAIATVRTLWKGETLYVLAEVADPIVDVTGSDPWIQDSVEIYVDPGNAKNGSYRYDDTQIRISAANAVSFGTGDEAFQRARVTSATAEVDGGYVVEAAIQLGDYAGLGTVHGLDFQVNDASNGARTAIRNWADPTGAGYQSTARWGVGGFVAADDEPGEPGEPDGPTVSLGATSVPAGGTVELELSGFAPDTEVSLVLQNPTVEPVAFAALLAAPVAAPLAEVALLAAPVALDSVTTDATGSAQLVATIPASVTPGSYELAAVVDGATLATAALDVTAAADPGTGAGDGTGSGSGTAGAGGLASTGVEVGLWLLLVAGLGTAGGLLVMRRRRTA
ncbi:endo-1,4-beta-xylanase [Agromyces larvae]|uniref:Beta-xylanase n=1 Tax=Agromyces larvae TaxID=2929802 RepID=A0ABY4BYC0_9MICO|nr:endo-1,4-beta-xylanase [Agromyces larvae]UOE44240.1 endo-1,4-beta-xylanase [Agromyces larvae]